MIKQILMLVALIATSFIYAQEPHSGQIIEDYGKIYSVNNPEYKTDTTAQYKVVLDVGRNFDNPAQPNKLIETAARFINMHREAGVPAKNLKVALVIHGSATNDILKSEFYEKAYSEVNVNPNAELISQLANQGVEVILCGQAAASRNITESEALPEVQIALSALTALIQLQNDGYRLINF